MATTEATAQLDGELAALRARGGWRLAAALGRNRVRPG
jgi:hypothetical protein